MDRRTAGVAPQLRLAEAYGSAPDMWLRRQMAYDDLAYATKFGAEITNDIHPFTMAAIARAEPISAEVHGSDNF